MGQGRIQRNVAEASKERKKNRKLIVGVYYKPPNPKDEVESDLLSQSGMAARQGNFIIMGDLNYPDKTAHSFKAGHKYLAGQRHVSIR